MTIQVRTTAADGLLVWSSGRHRKDDFFAVAVADGRPQLSFRLGEDQAVTTIRAKARVDDGRWHKLRVLRKRRVGVLQVDKERPERGRAERGATVLNTDGKLWIGELQVDRKFKGSFSSFLVQGSLKERAPGFEN